MMKNLLWVLRQFRIAQDLAFREWQYDPIVRRLDREIRSLEVSRGAGHRQAIAVIIKARISFEAKFFAAFRYQ